MRLIKLKIPYFLLFSYFCSFQLALGNITFFVRPFPQEQKGKKKDNEKLIEEIKIPGKITGKTIKKNLLSNNPNVGIFSTYFGYLALSNLNGQITFPRKTQKALFKLIITPRIKPILMIGNTIHHWELDPLADKILYIIELKQDATTNAWFWKTTKDILPENNIIPLDSIVLFAKPNNIYVPEGITLTNSNSQLLLPDIYAKKGLNITARALWVLTLRQFFSPLRAIFKKDSDTYFSQYLNVK